MRTTTCFKTIWLLVISLALSVSPTHSTWAQSNSSAKAIPDVASQRLQQEMERIVKLAKGTVGICLGNKPLPTLVV